jgi:hypothetical protein
MFYFSWLHAVVCDFLSVAEKAKEFTPYLHL